MLVKEIIRKKRDGGELSEPEIKALIEGISDNTVSREQISAFTMAVYFRSMNPAEVSALTRAMINSGKKINWQQHDLGGPVVDKHSTGGVGDKVSLMLAPMIAACGGYVPMISGRGLGHTGGTLDKMEAIPGYVTTPDLTKLAQVVKKVGCAIIGQTADLAPVDGVIYSVRDVTATVESVALITASILSKKISAGLDALVMDIKVGPGAFMKTEAEAEELASSIIETAAENGVPTHAILTSMEEVLGRTAGNALEVRETLDYLSGQARDPKLHEVVMALTSEMLLLSKLASNRQEAEAKLQAVLDNGKALEIFSEMVAALGGPIDFVEKSDQYLAMAPVIKPVFVKESGYVSDIDVRGVGNLIVKLGGGRSAPGQVLDMAVGLTDIARIGEYMDAEKISSALTSEMLLLSKLASNRQEAEAKLQAVLDNGKALEIFSEMVAALGGPIDFVEKSDQYLAMAPVIKPVFVKESGYVSDIDVRGVGNLIVKLGGGRSAPGQVLDMAVGLTDIARIGEYMDAEKPLGVVHARTEAGANQIIADMRACYSLSDQPQASPAVIRKLMT